MKREGEGREGREGEEEEKRKSKERKTREKRRKSGRAQPAKQVKGTHKIFFFFAEATEKIFARLPLDMLGGPCSEVSELYNIIQKHSKALPY